MEFSAQKPGAYSWSEPECYMSGKTLRASTLCEVEADTQQHLLVCEELEVSGAMVDSPPEYENLFASGLDEKLSISRILKEKFKIRKLKLEK